VSEEELANDKIKATLEDGAPVSLTDLENGISYSENGRFMTQRFSFKENGQASEANVMVTNTGKRGVYAEVTVHFKPVEQVLVVTSYRVYSSLPLLEIETTLRFSGSLTGVIEPSVIHPGFPRPRELWREIGGHINRVTIEKGKARFLLANNWLAACSGDKGLMIAGDGLTRALKEVRESNQEITLFRAETMFKANQYEHFTGSYKIRTAIIPLKKHIPLAQNKYI